MSRAFKQHYMVLIYNTITCIRLRELNCRRGMHEKSLKECLLLLCFTVIPFTILIDEMFRCIYWCGSIPSLAGSSSFPDWVRYFPEKVWGASLCFSIWSSSVLSCRSSCFLPDRSKESPRSDRLNRSRINTHYRHQPFMQKL